MRHVSQESIALLGQFQQPVAQPFELVAQTLQIDRPVDGDPWVKLPRPSSLMARSICRSGRLSRSANSSTTIKTSGSSRRTLQEQFAAGDGRFRAAAPATSASICCVAEADARSRRGPRAPRRPRPVRADSRPGCACPAPGRGSAPACRSGARTVPWHRDRAAGCQRSTIALSRCRGRETRQHVSSPSTW